jgi:two-component system response regulator FixJ
MLNEQIVHVVDDDADVRRSLQQLLETAGFEPVLHETPEAFLESMKKASQGCALLDVYMPRIDGLEVLAQLHGIRNPPPVIVMTGLSEVPVAVRAMKAGAVDFIEKPFDDKTLFAAIETAFARRNKADGVDEILDAARRIANLSLREHEVLDALVAGKPNKVIAFNLGISVRTVEVHRARMMDRLGVRQLAAAVRLAVLSRMEK